MDLQLLIEIATGLRASSKHPDVIAAYNMRLGNSSLVGYEDDEVYLINRLPETNHPLLVRRIVVRAPRDSEQYKEKLLRIFRKIFIHHRLGNLVKWSYTINSDLTTYYIAVSYAEATVPVSPWDVYDSRISLDKMRWDYGVQCLEVEIDL